MQTTIIFNEKDLENMSKQIAGSITNQVYNQVKKELKLQLMDNELLTKKELREQILHCSDRSADENFIYEPGFPIVYVGNDKRFPRKAVNEWLEKRAKLERR